MSRFNLRSRLRWLLFGPSDDDLQELLDLLSNVVVRTDLDLRVDLEALVKRRLGEVEDSYSKWILDRALSRFSWSRVRTWRQL